jgi:hypothetical protein
VPAAKAAVDGVRDVGVLVGDSPRCVRRITFVTQITGNDGFLVTLEALDELGAV